VVPVMNLSMQIRLEQRGDAERPRLIEPPR